MHKKVLIFQYGKVGSTTLRCNTTGEYFDLAIEDNNEYPDTVQTHSSWVASDFIEKNANEEILVICPLRLPVDRNLSDFWENIENRVPDWRNMNVNEINLHFDNSVFINHTNWWLDAFFKLFKIDKTIFRFDFASKYNCIKNKNCTILLYRFEDFKFVVNNVLPKFGIDVTDSYNIGNSKPYSEKYKEHKKMFRLTQEEANDIRNSEFINMFNTKNDIEEHINKWIDA